MTAQPLEGIRVLNFGHMGTAPLTCTWLSDWGAEVIKVESATKVDQTRFLVTVVNGLPPEDMRDSSMQFNMWNRGAKSCLANLKKPEAIELLKKLVKVCDVAIENYSPGFMKKIGLDYEEVKKVNPKIIYVSESAMGQEGPFKDIVTFGATIASISGKQSMQGYADGEAQTDFGMADCVGGVNGAFLICNALRYRNRTGEGQFFDMGQVAPILSCLGEPMMDYVMNGRIAGMQGNHRRGYCPRNTYRCMPNEIREQLPPDDEWIAISVETEDEWEIMCSVMGSPAWTKDEKFASRDQRWQNQDDLDELITQWTINYDKYELERRLQDAGIPAMAMYSMQEREWNPQYRARRVFRLKDWRAVKGVPQRGPGVNISGYETVYRFGPNLGEDTDYVYGELCSLSRDEIDKLKKDGVIA